MDKSDEASSRAELASAYRQCASIGLNELASGNLSCRLGGGMLISPTGATAETISPEAFVYMSLEGEWTGPVRPSTEWRMHAAIYQRHPKAKAIVHTHSDYCVAVACHGALPGFHYLVGSFGGNDVPCVPYSTFGSPKLAEDAADALTERSACLLGSHGMICRGPDLGAAVALAHRLEIMCRQYLLARALGEPYLLTAEEWRAFFDKAREVRYGRI
ncbi:MAG TPA: class II aldolase/adducin family protein [Caulobacteraceae bacterium]|nr:class II aldolase/adducin family protein [Caulobacteraceae bacterium]